MSGYQRDTLIWVSIWVFTVGAFTVSPKAINLCTRDGKPFSMECNSAGEARFMDARGYASQIFPSREEADIALNHYKASRDWHVCQ